MDFSKIKENKFLIIILIIALLIRISFAYSIPVKWWDETVYANLGYDLVKNPLDYSFAHNGWSDFVPSGGDPVYSWPRAGFRAPLLPVVISFFYLFKIDFLITFIIPIIGVLTVFFVYLLGIKMFDKRVGLVSAFILALLPLHVEYSGKILTDVFSSFFVLLTIFIFWKGYEENNRKYKVLFGFVLALSLLARYTTLWIIPVFFIYFLIRCKSFKFLKDRYLWCAVVVFFITLAPLFVYSYYQYNNFFGAFIHGLKASSYWGGVQPWYFYFKYSLEMFSIIGFVFLAGVSYIIYKKEFLKKGVYFLLIWVFFFLIMAILMPHKEGRFILPIIPGICLISGLISKIKNKPLFHVLLFVVTILLLASIYLQLNKDIKGAYTDTNLCFLEANKFLKNISKGLVVTDESPIVYYYSKKETHFYPNPWSIESLRDLIENNYDMESAYILFSDYDMPLNNEKNINVKKDLDKNFEIVFACQNKTFVYKYEK